ncbi:hypothetical protein BDZ89DRAFT_1086219 [Hymenopellis radicata]|nr:hypothetical protein BDZ89DRAFT_1086219 [Hymenopellis radicata]
MEYGDDYSRAQLAMESMTKIYPSSKNYSPDYSKKVFGPNPFTFAVLDSVRTLGDQPLGPTEVEPGALSSTARGRPTRIAGSRTFVDTMRPKSQLKHTTSSASASSALPSASSKASTPVATHRSSGGPVRHTRGVRTTLAQTVGKIKYWVASS